MMNRQTLPARTVRWLLLALLLFVLGITGLKLLYPFSYQQQIDRWASSYSIDPYLVAAIIRTESHSRTRAISSAGAIGLMQIMPATGEWIADKIGVDVFTTDDLYDPETNIRLGIWYLRYLIDRFGRVDTALAAYNAGPGNVERWQKEGEDAFPETVEYVRKVVEGERTYRFLYTLPFLGSLLHTVPI